MKNFLIFSVAILFFFNARAQQGKIYHKIFTKQEGLEIDIIKAMTFDNDGFLWLGGENLDIRTIIQSDKKLAIQRFNGVSFHTIPLPEFKERLIRIDQIYKRADGKFYVQAGFSSGLRMLLFDPYTMAFTTVLVSEQTSRLKAVSPVFNVQQDNILLTQQDQTIFVNRLNDDLSMTVMFSFDQTEYNFLLDSSTKFIPFEEFCVIGDDNFPLQFLSWNGKKLKEYSGEAFKRQRDIVKNKFYIDEIFVNRDTSFVFMNNDPELYFVDENEQEFKIISNGSLNNNLHEIYTDNYSNTMSFSVNDETLRFSTMGDTGFEEKYILEYFKSSSAIQTVSNNLKEDVWIGTSNTELHYFRFPSEKIKTYLPDSSIRTIFRRDSENYIVATENNGWFLLNSTSNEIKKYNLFENGVPIEPRSSRNIIKKGNRLWSNSISSIISVEADASVNAYRHYPVLCLESLSDSTLVYGTKGYNLMEFNVVTKQHTPLAVTDSLVIYDLAVTKEYVVGATDKGILSYHLKSGEAKLFQDVPGMEDPFLLMADTYKDYPFILGSRAGDIITFDPKTDKTESIYKDALEVGIAGIAYGEDTWWINTFNGVVAWNSLDGSSKRYFEKDGLSHNEGNRYSILKTEKGIFSGTLKGLNYFDPTSLNFIEKDMELVLLKVRNYDGSKNGIRDKYDRTALNNHSIELPSEYRELELDFGITNNIANREHSYRYSLNNSEWIPIKQPTIHFPNLAAGNYRLKIEAWDSSRKQIGKTLTLAIQSKNFFYKTWWFYGMLLFILTGLFYYLLKQAISKKKLQEDFSANLMVSQEVERTRIAKELHDSVGQQLTLIKKRAQKDEQEAITKLTHNALEEIREISRGLYPTMLKQLGLTESIEQLVYELDEKSSMFFSSEIDDIDSVFNEQQTLNFYRFIQECMSNILKHSEATSVLLTITNTKSKVVLEIKDNGIGFDHVTQLKKNSLGLKTMTERVRMLHGILNIESKTGQGTYIKAEIPKK